ncbi:hypothetical protein NDU88_000285 [Pleurodeles waltl]|uniref:Uncharacterized protein n=1 Tax=Pleurodeles waltl TaxID=8319 RepID=A0AAV7KN24_PLEWA|nr:hypothetical protein NDU88_000285 [Pleurodeles waltl]
MAEGVASSADSTGGEHRMVTPEGVMAPGKSHLETSMDNQSSTEPYVNDFWNAPGTKKTESDAAGTIT